MTSMGDHGARRARAFTYHPFEVALCGPPDATAALAGRLLQHWRGRLDVGFVPHDAPRSARSGTLPPSRFERACAFVDADFVLAGEAGSSDLPTLLVLDAEGQAPQEHAEGRIPNVIGVVGPAGRPATPGEVLPSFSHDDVAGLAAFVEAHVRARAAAPLYGLVLAGGESRRMGAPKWALDYAGEPHAQRTARLLGAVCERVFVSVRPGQEDRRVPGVPAIADAFPPWGPVAGLLSAMEAYPDAAWLVAACDLPFLGEPALQTLVAGRDPLKIATAFRSARDGRPEPLCAVWEPRARLRLLQAAGMGLTCPRRVLEGSAPILLPPPSAGALENANTPAEYHAARAALHRSAHP